MYTFTHSTLPACNKQSFKKLTLWALGITAAAGLVAGGSLLLPGKVAAGQASKALPAAGLDPVAPARLPSPGAKPVTVVQRRPGVQEAQPLILFTLYDNGIEPSVVHARTGTVTVSIISRSPRGTGLVVGAFGRVGLDNGGRTGQGQFTLRPGIYQVHEDNNTNNSAELVVIP